MKNHNVRKPRKNNNRQFKMIGSWILFAFILIDVFFIHGIQNNTIACVLLIIGFLGIAIVETMNPVKLKRIVNRFTGVESQRHHRR